MKLIYVCGPIRHGFIWHNVAQADDAMLLLMREGFSVINPMLSCWAGLASRAVTHGVDGDSLAPRPSAHGDFRDLTPEVWLAMDLEMVRRCDMVLRLPGRSDGADGEVAEAVRCGIPVYYSVQELLDATASRQDGSDLRE